jgi:hypothetical protein
MSRLIDHSPVSVTGELHATRARVIWRDGRLIVFRTSKDWTVFDAPDDPQEVRRGHWESVGVRWRSGGCKCGCSLCKIGRDRLLAKIEDEHSVTAG